MTISQIFITEKIKLVEEYLDKAKEVFGAEDDAQILGSNNIHVLERLFQLMVDAVIDINNYLVKELNLEPPDSIQGSFEILSEHKIISNKLAIKIAPVVGLRNRIVHVYEKVDKPFFVDQFRKNVNDFDQYIIEILEYIKRF